MKTNYLFLAFSAATLTFTSCSSEIEDVLETQEEQVTAQDSVFTYDMYLDAEKTSYDGTTRATTANDWENGDIVFLRFANSGSEAYGKAEYISSSNKWRVTCEKALTEATNSSCYVWYGEGVNPSVYSSSSYDYMTEAYSTTSGKYTYANNGIYVSATMRPVGWRLRFKGSVGTEVAIYFISIIYYQGINTQKIGFYKSYGSRKTLTVGSNGYTDYVVGSTESSCTQIFISNCTTGDTFYRYFDGNTLKEGESGCYTIPTASSLHGWTQSNTVSGTINGHQYVDLGLPSGLKWATCNIGASSPTEIGNYYAWGETSTKSSFTSDNYTYTGTSDLSGDSDAAYVNWGSSWRMPTEDEANELSNGCFDCNVTLNGVSGYIYIGPNGKSIFLPDSGYYSGTSLHDENTPYSWTSTYSSSSYAYYFYYYMSYTISRYYGLPIRPVVSN